MRKGDYVALQIGLRRNVISGKGPERHNGSPEEVKLCHAQFKEKDLQNLEA